MLMFWMIPPVRDASGTEVVAAAAYMSCNIFRRCSCSGSMLGGAA